MTTNNETEVRKAFPKFLKWANDEGYDTAHTFDSERRRWICLNPMTADLWRSYQAAIASVQQRQQLAQPAGNVGDVEPAITSALELYAQSYDMMDGKVDASTVALDIRTNFAKSVMHSITLLSTAAVKAEQLATERITDVGDLCACLEFWESHHPDCPTFLPKLDLFFIGNRLAEKWHADFHWKDGKAELVNARWIELRDLLPFFHNYAHVAIEANLASKREGEAVPANRPGELIGIEVNSKNGVRAFRHKETHEIRYCLSNEHMPETQWDDILIVELHDPAHPPANQGADFKNAPQKEL